MLSVFETGEASFRLSNQRDEDVGWIRGSALGFGGFATEEEALDAALAGSAALTGYLDRLTGSVGVDPRGTAPASGRVRVVHDGAYEWVTRGKVPLARLYRPERDAAERERRQTFAIEFVLPSYAKAGAAVSASQVVYRAIAREAVAEAPRRPSASLAADDAAEAAPAPAVPSRRAVPVSLDGVAVG